MPIPCTDEIPGYCADLARTATHTLIALQRYRTIAGEENIPASTTGKSNLITDELSGIRAIKLYCRLSGGQPDLHVQPLRPPANIAD